MDLKCPISVYSVSIGASILSLVSYKVSLEQIRGLLEASQEMRFAGHGRAEVYAWIGKTLSKQHYSQQCREAKGLLRSYLARMTGFCRWQATRLIGQHLHQGEVKEAVYRRHRFPTRYTRKILEREFNEFGKHEYAGLAEISVAHLYRLRHSKSYRTRQTHFTKSKPTLVAIGERRCPEPVGRPGYLRVDTVHQGDRDGVKGVYHINAVNAVDEVTQWQVVACVPQISEAWLLPALLSITADNGSEFINHKTHELYAHRPCGQAELTTDAKGKQKRVYRRYLTSWEVFSKLPNAGRDLKPGQSSRRV